MKETVIPIITGIFGTVPKDLATRLGELKIGGHAETIQITSLLMSANLLRRDLEI